ncbi:MAG: ribosome maturation factor RimP [Candidatus Dadabacteria bacterium]|nr:ribosome maturation factor RimP [Candidatus Dadabacteria bacterium]
MENAERKLEKAICEVLHPIVEENSCELVDIKYMRERGGRILRIFLDKEGGITVDDCANVSRELSVVLDAYDIMPQHSYTLEVSSPGLRRPLKRHSDYERFKGRKVKIKTTDPVEDRKIFSGTLLGMEGEMILMEVDGRSYSVPLASVSRANLEIDFGKGAIK